MIHAILFILKIIGIALLSLLALILVLILIVLFVPVRYRIKARKGEAIEGNVQIHWLLHIVSSRISFGEKTNIIVKIFGIPIYDKLKKEANPSSTTKTKNKKTKKNKQNTRDESAEKTNENVSKNTTDNTDENNYNNSNKKNSGLDETQTQEKKSSTKIGLFFNQIEEFVKKIITVFKNFKCKVLGIYDTIKDVINNIEYYLNLLERDDVTRAIALSKKQIWKLLYSIRPRKFLLKIRLGMENPETLGKILSYYSAFYPVYRDHIMMQPEFNQTIFEGSLYAKGKITGFILLRTAWVLYFNQDIRRTIALLKREEI